MLNFIRISSKQYLFLTFCVLALSLNSNIYAAQNPTEKPKYIEFPLKFNEANLPYLYIKVGEKNVPFLFDLGFKPGLSIEKKVMKELIKEKVKLREDERMDVNGKVRMTFSGKAKT